MWIKNLSRLIRSQLTRNKKSIHVCDKCLHYFHSSEKLERHLELCKEINNCRVRLPSGENKILRFKDYRFKEKVPFIVYSDFESILEPMQDEKKIVRHKAVSVGYYFKCSCDDSMSYYKSYRARPGGLEPTVWFVQELDKLADRLQ